ncbi:hypothetical protein C8Q80DRAFT_1243572, partial [Daedaleopsis nitida]
MQRHPVPPLLRHLPERLASSLDLHPRRRSMSARGRRGHRYALGKTARGSGFARRELEMRSRFRKLINTHLAIRSGKPKMRMCWTVSTYVKTIFIKLGLELIGWPPSLPFTNPSNEELTGLARISLLLSLWETGKMCFVHVSDEDRRAAADDPLSAAPNVRHRGLTEREERGDSGERRLRPVSDPMNFPQLPKSAAVVSDAMEAEVE